MAALSPVAAGGATTPRSVGRAASPPLGLQAAGVGGVDDEPEVFETEGDGPREGLVDGPIATEDEGAAGAAGGAGGSSVETATLDTTPLSAESAFATFMGKLYDRAGAGALQSAGQETSYEVHTEATRSGRGGRPLGTISGVETPLQRFQRLKAEVQELDDDLSALATAHSKEGALKMPAAWAEAIEGVGELRADLSDLSIQDTVMPLLRTDVDVDPSLALQSQLTSKILNHVEEAASLAGEGVAKAQQASGAVGTEGPTGGASASDGESTGAGVTYELYLKGRPRRDNVLEQLGRVEARIAALEAKVGSGPDESATIGGIPALPGMRGSGSESLAVRTAHLERVVGLLDAGQARTIGARASEVTAKLRSLAAVYDDRDPTSAARLAAHEKRVQAVHTMMEEWNTVAAELPAIVARLRTLKVLHEEAAMFTQRLGTVEVAQKSLNATVADLTSSFAELRTSFDANMATIVANISAMDRRFERIFDQLGMEESKDE